MTDHSALLVNAVGVGAAVCSMTSFVPQIVKLLRERDGSGVSFRMYAVTIVGFSLWIAFGVLTKSWPVAASNVVNLAMATTILTLKLRLDRS